MNTYTEEQLKKLGIPFYEDYIPELKEKVESSKFYGKEVTEEESYSPEYEIFIIDQWVLDTIKDCKGPMNISHMGYFLT